MKLRRRGDGRKHTRVIFQGALLVGRLELSLGGIGRDAENVVKLCFFDHIGD